MNSNQETADIRETDFGGLALPKQKKIIHFSSGETLEVKGSEDEEEKEQPSSITPFQEPVEKIRLFKNVAFQVGRMSLLACDFLGERLAGALGLNAAKYQYAIDLYHRENKTTVDHIEGAAETVHLSPGPGRGHYGATRDKNCPPDPKKSCDEGHVDRQNSCLNREYQGDEDS